MIDFDKIHDRTNTWSLKWDRYPGETLPLWVADMDFLSPEPVIQALKDRAEHGIFGYTEPPASLEETVISHLSNKYDWQISNEDLNWYPGLVPALNLACLAYAKTDEVIISPTPVYPPFLTAPHNMRRKLETVPLRKNGDEWELNLEDLKASLTDKSKILFFCNPHNPVGKVFSYEELKAIGEFCIENNLIIISDEIHCDLVFDKSAKHIPMASISPEIADITVTLMAPSKTYNLPGLSCSFVIIQNKRLRTKFVRESRGLFNEINCFGYAGCEAAFKYGNEWLEQLLVYLKNNYDYLYNFVNNELPGVSMAPMQATYLGWMNMSETGLENPEQSFLDAGVALSNGRYFHDKNYLRINFGCPRPTLEEGLKRMRSVFK